MRRSIFVLLLALGMAPIGAVAQEIPPDQAAFLALVKQFSAKWSSETNTSRRAGMAQERARELRKVLAGEGAEFKDWRLRVHEVTITANGGAFVTLVSCESCSGAWFFFDTAIGSNFPRGSALFQQARALDIDQWVSASGSLRTDAIGLVDGVPDNEDGPVLRMRHPYFEATFTSLKKL